MLKTALLIALALGIALLGGAGSVAYVLASGYSADAVRVGPWTAFPNFGTRNADPYVRAEVARNGILALGRAEGVAFGADTDSDGKPLDAGCAYLLSGQTPPGRFWTFWAGSGDAPSSRSALHSQALLRQADGSIRISVGRKPMPGNWLPVRASDRLRFTLTVYDASAIAGAVSSDIAMPRIEQVGCDG